MFSVCIGRSRSSRIDDLKNTKERQESSIAGHIPLWFLTRRFVGLRPSQATRACPERLSAAKESNGAVVAAKSDEMTLPAVVKTR